MRETLLPWRFLARWIAFTLYVWLGIQPKYLGWNIMLITAVFVVLSWVFIGPGPLEPGGIITLVEFAIGFYVGFFLMNRPEEPDGDEEAVVLDSAFNDSGFFLSFGTLILWCEIWATLGFVYLILGLYTIAIGRAVFVIGLLMTTIHISGGTKGRLWKKLSQLIAKKAPARLPRPVG